MVFAVLAGAMATAELGPPAPPASTAPDTQQQCLDCCGTLAEPATTRCTGILCLPCATSYSCTTTQSGISGSLRCSLCASDPPPDCTGGAVSVGYHAGAYGYPQAGAGYIGQPGYGYAPGYGYPPGYGYAPGYYPGYHHSGVGLATTALAGAAVGAALGAAAGGPRTTTVVHHTPAYHQPVPMGQPVHQPTYHQPVPIGRPVHSSYHGGGFRRYRLESEGLSRLSAAAVSPPGLGVLALVLGALTTLLARRLRRQRQPPQEGTGLQLL